jgi:hypothetical protein
VEGIIEDNALKIIDLINKFSGRTKELESIRSKMIKAFTKRMSRIGYGYGEGYKISITTVRNLFISCHMTSADLSILNYFETFKERLDIVNKCFTTRGLPLIEIKSKSKSNSGSDSVWASNVHVRDTVLLAPAGQKSLASIGSIYGKEFEKIDIGSYRGGNMKKLLDENKPLFEKYAVQDALITLKHVNEMQKFYFDIRKVGVPLSLSSISNRYVEEWWGKIGYKGYQIRKDYLLGNVGDIVTPKGLISVVDLGLDLNYFVASYRGGRNESYMYGVDRKLFRVKKYRIGGYNFLNH